MPRCEICNYETDRTDNYAKHLKSTKHIKRLAGAENPQKESLDKYASRITEMYDRMVALNKEEKEYMRKKYDTMLVEEIGKRDLVIKQMSNYIGELQKTQKELLADLGFDDVFRWEDSKTKSGSRK
jgi:nucleoside-triphosphatase THEP1